MLYKGSDLDLVTPQGSGAGRALSRPAPTGAWLARALEPAGSLPSLWVDESVLRCCKQAYDLAVVHRAADVGLEHLVHAMTLVVETIEVLRAYNVDVTNLRQESAAIIASELPVAHTNGHASPTNSEEFVRVLRFAAERAYAHRSPVTTEDILDTLFDMKSDHSSRNLLSRHRADWRLRTSPEVHHDDHREPGREAPTVTDSLQNTRIEALERLVHELSGDIAENRRSFSELIDELRASTGSERRAIGHTNGSADHHPTDAVVDRLYGIERNVETKFDELARAWDVLGKRIDLLEDAVEAAPVGGEPSTVEALNESVEELTGLAAKIDKLEAVLAALPDRLMAMERRLAQAGNSQAPADLTPLTAKLGALEKLIESSPGGNVEMAPVVNTLGAVEQRVDDTGLVVDSLIERLDKIDTAIDNQGVGGERMKALVDDAMRGVAQTFNTQRDEIAQGVSNAVAERLGVLSTAVQGRQTEHDRLLVAMAERVTALEARLGGEAERIVSVITSVDRESDATHDALIKLNTNQQTLATAFDQWRLDSKNDISAILNRLQVVQTGNDGPQTDLIDLQDKIDNLQASLASRQDFWTRFRIWLYGTDDWYAASWGRRHTRDI